MLFPPQDVVLLMPPLPNFGTGQGLTWSDRVQVLELCRTLIQEQQSSSKFRIMELVEASVPILRLQWGGGKGGGIGGGIIGKGGGIENGGIMLVGGIGGIGC